MLIKPKTLHNPPQLILPTIQIYGTQNRFHSRSNHLIAYHLRTRVRNNTRIQSNAPPPPSAVNAVFPHLSCRSCVHWPLVGGGCFS
jgi:hypothetical protein